MTLFHSDPARPKHAIAENFDSHPDNTTCSSSQWPFTVFTAFLCHEILTINVPLILKVRDIIIFFAGKTCNGAFQKGRGPLEKPQEMPHYMFCPRQKNNFQDFQNQRCIGIFMSQRRRREMRDKRTRDKRWEMRDERVRERESERRRVSKRIIVRSIIFLNRPGQNDKSGKYWKERCSMYLTFPRGS